MSSTPRSLVLGAYSGLPARYLEPFARSLRATGYRGSFCVIVGKHGRGERAALDALADAVVDVGQDYPAELPAARALLAFLRRTRGLRRAYPRVFERVAGATAERAAYRRWSSLEYHLEGLQALRYAHYHRYLAECAQAADVVMISDLRDVVFQRDPFAEPVSGLEVYLEDPSVRIGEDAFNTRWVRDLVGTEGLERLRGLPVSCSGTVVGTRDAMLAYLGEMVAGISWRRRPMGPHDQAVHNLLVHGRGLSAARIVPNGHGRVLTLGSVTTYRTNGEGKIMNDDGSVPAVLHQWDRHQALAECVLREGDLTFVPSPT